MVDDDETRERLTSSIEEMQGMLDATLSYARGVNSAEAPVRLDAGRLLEEINQALPSQFVLKLGPEAAISVRPFAVRRALRNLIENAQRYGGNVCVTHAIKDDLVEIRIEDDGPGVPDDQLEQVFAPFYRLEHSRSLDTGGHGLGLSIARSILRAHGGEVVLSNAEAGGLVALVSLPLERMAPLSADDDAFPEHDSNSGAALSPVIPTKP